MEPRIIFFSRGRGSGHATPDLALGQAIREAIPGIDIRWASYGTGAATIRRWGEEVIDLELPEVNPYLETQIKVAAVIQKLIPNMVIAHEEFAVPPIAKIFGVPVTFLTDYFVPPSHIWMESLLYANEIIFIDQHGWFDEPPLLRDKIRYTGPLVRTLTYARGERRRARAELKLGENEVVVLVLPGNWFTEAKAPIFNLVWAAFKSLQVGPKRLVWIAGQDCEELRERTRHYSDVTVLEHSLQVEQWMVASDVALTKGTRKTSIELAFLGVPSIALSPQQNPIDDQRVSKLPTNIHLNAAKLHPDALRCHIQSVLDIKEGEAGSAIPLMSGFQATVDRLVENIWTATHCLASPVCN